MLWVRFELTMTHLAACRYMGFCSRYASPPVAHPVLQHYLNMNLLLQFIWYLRKRGCSRATLAAHADVAIKVVLWLIADQQLLPGTTVAAAHQHKKLLENLRHQLRTSLPPKPRRPMGDLLSPEHLTFLIQEVYDEVVQYEGSMSIGQCSHLLKACCSCGC